MPSCPICSADSTTKYKDSPYWVCPNCACWFQSPMGNKVYVAEVDPAEMGEEERQINRNLATWLFKDVMGSTPGPTLDIGGRLPVLADSFAALGCDAIVLDPDPITFGFDRVRILKADFERDEWLREWPQQFDLISLVHVYEHFFNPLTVMEKLRTLLANDGRVYLRLPQHNITGFERDLIDDRYRIHPYFHCATSILECCMRTNAFTLERYIPLHSAGQADIVLRPL